MWDKLYPAIPRHWLFAIAGLVWMTVGVILCIRALGWLARFSMSAQVLLELAGVALAGIGYLLLFKKVVRKNVDRISGLPERACAFAFTPWRGYVMIGLMVTLGITLRNSPIRKDVLAVPYTAMGVMLLTGSVVFYRRFLSFRQKA